jgi:hypothetical protein
VDFANIIAEHLSEIWGFLMLVGRISAVIVVLVGAILWLTEMNISKGKQLVTSGILLAVVIQYFVMYPPSFALG